MITLVEAEVPRKKLVAFERTSTTHRKKASKYIVVAISRNTLVLNTRYEVVSDRRAPDCPAATPSGFHLEAFFN